MHLQVCILLITSKKSYHITHTLVRRYKSSTRISHYCVQIEWLKIYGNILSHKLGSPACHWLVSLLLTIFLSFLLYQRDLAVACEFNNSIWKLLFQTFVLKAINVSTVYYNNLWSCSKNSWETLNSCTELAIDSLDFTMTEHLMKPNTEIKDRFHILPRTEKNHYYQKPEKKNKLEKN